VRADGSFSPQAMRDEVQGMLTKTVAILASKAIQYSDLKNALTPQLNRPTQSAKLGHLRKI
jgi:hypothetical protein